jgi:uncharacterized protein YbaA (DUF1428 family)
MSRYVDGYVIPLKKKDLKLYKKMATVGCKVWMEHGALDYYECVGDNLDLPYGIPFTKLCKLKPDETVIFAYIVYESKAHAKQVLKKVHADPRMNPENFKKMPFEMKKFTAGKFKVLVNAK